MTSTEELVRALRDARVSVAVAESAAGGLIAARLTGPTGSSAYFRGGVVAYDDASKTGLLGIPTAVFVKHGSVSREACAALAEAARRVFQADYGIGETSIAGPTGATAEKPVGLSFVGVASSGGTEVREHHFAGSREANRQAAVQAAMDLLLARLL